MAGKSVLYRIYEDLVGAVKEVIDTKYIFPDRPDSKQEEKPMTKFVVIDFPSDMEDYVIGSKRSLINTVGVIYLFTASARGDMLDIKASGNFTDSVIALFPINGKCCTAANPVVRGRGSDGNGFHLTTITFDLQTKWRAFG